jgi:PAS domain S-box-containing protein
MALQEHHCPRFSEDFFRTLVEHANDAIAVLQHEKRIYRNAAYSRLLGYTDEDIEHTRSSAIIAPEDRQRVQEYYYKRLRGEAVPDQYEMDVLHRNGQRLTVEVKPCVITVHGEPATLVVMGDITERKRTEKALRDAHQQTAQLLQAIPSILIGLDLQGRVIWWNTAAEQTFGLQGAEILSQPLLHSGIAWETAKLAEGLARCRATHTVVSLDDLCLQHVDAEERLLGITINPMHEVAGELSGFLLLGADITTRKRTEQEREEMVSLLMESNDSLEELNTRVQQSYRETEQLLASISAILIGVDAQGCIIRWNATAESIFGITADAVIGQPFSACGIEWDIEPILSCINTCRQTLHPTPVVDVRFTRSNGTKGFLGVTVSPMKTESDAVAGFILIGVDVTERKMLESQLVQAQKLESIGQLAAGIAHEINTPTQYVGDNVRFLQEAFTDLATLIEHTTDLLQAAKDGMPLAPLIEAAEASAKTIDVDYVLEEVPNAIRQTLEGVERVATIVRAMKEFSHPGHEEKTAIDLNQAIDSTITVARNEWKYVADMVTDLAPMLPLVPCLPGAFNQVILNMIVNAAHAIAEAIEKGHGTKGTITVSTKHVDKWVEIWIADTGAGIPVAVRERIFDPFFTTKEVGKGTGQGLAIAHDVVVKKHGGTITFESEEGRGTTFRIRLPLEG